MQLLDQRMACMLHACKQKPISIAPFQLYNAPPVIKRERARASSSPQSLLRLRSKEKDRFTPLPFFESKLSERRMMLLLLTGVGAQRSGRETSTT
jgi:hypothetical protein